MLLNSGCCFIKCGMVSKLVFYAQSTGAVISGQLRDGNYKYGVNKSRGVKMQVLFE